VVKLYEQLSQEKDTKEIDALNQKIDETQKQLGPEYLALANATEKMGEESADFIEIWSPVNDLNDSCTH
jgi:uncharacterized membrane protein YukC